VAVIHNTTMDPSKLDLLARWLPDQAWFPGTVSGLTRAGGFRLDDPEGEVGIEIMVIEDGDGNAYAVPMTYRGAPLDGADDGLIGTSEHGVLGRRWVYDGERDPVFRAQLAALLRGDVLAQAQSVSDTVDPAVQVQAVSRISEVRIARALSDDPARPSGRASVSATWKRADGTIARGVVAVGS
jgi:hypothetical protein